MNKVYIVIQSFEYEGFCIIKCLSSKESAEKFLKELSDKNPDFPVLDEYSWNEDGYCILEENVDN